MIASMRNSWAAAVLAAVWVGACSSGSQSPPPAGASGGSAGSGASSSTSGSGGKAHAGTPSTDGGALPNGEAGDAPVAGQGGAEVGEAGAPQGLAGADDGAGGDPPYVEPFPEPVCLGSAELGTPTKLEISTADDDQFGGITADELVIAWTVVAVDKVTLHYARRASKTDDFGNEGSLELAEAADDSVTLSPDGLRVAYVKSDRKGFTQLVRTAIDEPFGTVDSFDFSVIAESAQEFATDEYVGDPVLGQDGLSFFYSRYGAGRTKTLLRTLRFSQFAPWPPGSELAVAPGLEAMGEDRLRPTGVSVDSQSLFLWDSAAGSQKVAVQSHDTASYDVAFELDDARGAAPNGACSRVYFDRDGDLWSAELK